LQNNQAISIGRGSASSGQFWDGDIANVAVWSETLTDAQMLSVYNSGHNGNIASIQSSDLELYYTFNPYASTDADTNSTVQDRSGNNNDSTSVSGAVIDRTGTVAGTPDSITIREGLTSGKDGLGFPLTNPSSNVVRLNGVNEYVEVNDSSIWDFNINDFSVSYWFKVKNIDWNWAIGRQNSSANEDVWRAGINNSGKIIFRDIAGSDDSVGSTTILVDTWYHFTAVRNNGTLKVYLNESEDGTVASSGNLDSDKPIKIGSSGHYTSDEWDGLLDEVRIYNRALSTTEISKNYKHQKGKHKND